MPTLRIQPPSDAGLAHHPGSSSCIVCGSAQLSELAGSYQAKTHEARFLVCDRCGTLAREPHPSAYGSVERYAQDFYHPSWMESSHQEVLEAFAERMPELVRWVGPNARVLEIGSFVGGFLAAAQRQGWRAEGVDVGRCVTNFARGKGLNVHQGGLADTRFPDRTFDAVFIWCCFDQLPRPWEDLEEIHRILKDDGRLLIRVPNGEFVERIQRLERWTTSPALREMLQNILAHAGLAGFPFQIGYTPSSLTGMLWNSGFASVSIRNRHNVRGSDPDRRSAFADQPASTALRLVHVGSQILDSATFGAVKWGPWIEASCSKARLAAATGNPLWSCCVA